MYNVVGDQWNILNLLSQTDVTFTFGKIEGGVFPKLKKVQVWTKNDLTKINCIWEYNMALVVQT